MNTFSVTGVNIHVITPIVCLVCVFYTCAVSKSQNKIIAFLKKAENSPLQGGLKAVVWTDVIQTFSMFGALILVAVKGSYDIGGAGVVFENAWKTNRIEAPMYGAIITVYFAFWQN